MAESKIFGFSRAVKTRKMGLILGSAVYAAAYIALYCKYVPRVWDFQLVLLPLVLASVVVTALSIRYGTLVMVFFIPVANSLPYFFGFGGFNPLLFLFYGYVWGVLIHQIVHPVKIRMKGPLFAPVLGASVVVLVSAVFTLWRYANFFPLHGASVFDLAVNVLNVSSGEALRRVFLDSLNVLGGFIWFYAVLSVMKAKRTVYLAVSVLAVSCFVSFMFGVYQDVGNSGLGNQAFFSDAFRVNALFTDPNALGVFLALVIPVLAGAMMMKKRWGKAIFLLPLVAGIALVPDAGSRVGMLGLALGIGFSVVLLVRLGMKARKEKPEVWRLVISHISVAVLAAAMIAAFVLVNKKSTLYDRLYENIRALKVFFDPVGKEVILHGRHLTWPAAVAMIGEYPVSGLGIGSFTSECPNYFRKYDIAPVKGSFYYREIPPPDFRVDTAGNYYLQVGAELGIVGLFVFGWIFWLVGRRIYRLNFREKEISERRFLEIGLSSAVLAMFIIFLLGAHTVHFEIQMTFWLFVGLLYVIAPAGSGEKAEKEPEGASSLSRIARTFLVVLVVVFTIGCVWNSFNSLSLKERTGRFHIAQEFGLYQREKMDGRPFRWTKKAAGLTVKVKGPVMVVPVLASHPDIRDNPVRVRVYLTEDVFRERRPLDEFVLEDTIWEERRFDFADMMGAEFLLVFDISRTWRPKDALGSADPRELGIAIGQIRWQDSKKIEEQTARESDDRAFRFEPSDEEREMGGRYAPITSWCFDAVLPEGEFVFTLRAKGQEADGETAFAGVWLDGRLIGEDWIAHDVWADYYFRQRLEEGKHHICIEFMNEDYIPQTRQYRKLFLDRLVLKKVPGTFLQGKK